MKKKKDLNIQIGKRIQKARLSAGMTQADLADGVEVSEQYISDLERGVVGASVQTLMNICSVLSLTSDSILFGVVDVPSGMLFQQLESLSVKEFRLVEESVRLMLEAFNLSKNESQKK